VAVEVAILTLLQKMVVMAVLAAAVVVLLQVVELAELQLLDKEITADLVDGMALTHEQAVAAVEQAQ
jgi:hypothetical protein